MKLQLYYIYLIIKVFTCKFFILILYDSSFLVTDNIIKGMVYICYSSKLTLGHFFQPREILNQTRLFFLNLGNKKLLLPFPHQPPLSCDDGLFKLHIIAYKMKYNVFTINKIIYYNLLFVGTGITRSQYKKLFTIPFTIRC